MKCPLSVHYRTLCQPRVTLVDTSSAAAGTYVATAAVCLWRHGTTGWMNRSVQSPFRCRHRTTTSPVPRRHPLLARLHAARQHSAVAVASGLAIVGCRPVPRAAITLRGPRARSDIPIAGGEAYVQGDPDTPKAWIAVSTQTDPWSPTRRVRKQLFDPHHRTLKTVPSAPPPSPYDYGLRVDTRVTRRYCDCASCVRHSLRLLKSDVREFLPSAPGIRFVHLPLQGAVSTVAERQELDATRNERPQATYVACGCDRCGAHRDLLRAFREARRLTQPDDSSTVNLEPPALQ